jgi:hypothetical protein
MVGTAGHGCAHLPDPLPRHLGREKHPQSLEIIQYPEEKRTTFLGGSLIFSRMKTEDWISSLWAVGGT